MQPRNANTLTGPRSFNVVFTLLGSTVNKKCKIKIKQCLPVLMNIKDEIAEKLDLKLTEQVRTTLSWVIHKTRLTFFFINS